MLTRITCPHCGHVGATAASLPRVLICSQCEHGAFIKSGTPARSPTVEREERAAERAAWERLAPPATARLNGQDYQDWQYPELTGS